MSLVEIVVNAVVIIIILAVLLVVAIHGMVGVIVGQLVMPVVLLKKEITNAMIRVGLYIGTNQAHVLNKKDM